MLSNLYDSISYRLGVRGKHQNLVLYILLLLTILDVGWWIITHPFMRLYENAVCRAYYLKHDPSKISQHGFVKESECKIDEIQAAFGSLNGWWSFIGSVLGLFVADYYGRVADRRGRKYIWSLNLSMFLLSHISQYFICQYYHLFPDPRALWLTSTTYLIGGGPKLLSPMLMAMMADLVDAAERTKLFLAVSLIQLGCEVVGSEIGSLLLQKHIVLPFQLGLLLAVMLVVGTIFLPETLQLVPKTNGGIAAAYHQASDIELESSRNYDDSSSDDEGETTGNLSFQRGMLADSRMTLAQRGASYLRKFLPSNPALIPLGVAFYAFWFDYYLGYYSIQWVSLKYSWTIATVGKILPVSAAFKMANLLIIYPFTSEILRQNFRWSVIQTEITLTKAACASLAVGNFLIGATPPTWHGLILGLFVCSFGASLQPLLRSLMIQLVRSDQIGQLMAGITIVQAICTLTAGPSYSQALKIALAIKILGVPFFLNAALQMAATAFLMTSTTKEQFIKGA